MLAHVQASHDLVQDFDPLADSLEWELGQEYLGQRGNKAFLRTLRGSPSSSTTTAQGGRFELAATHYREGLQRQPGNWVLLNEISTFLTFQLRDLKAGIDMAKLALAQNPTCSADLWSTLGVLPPSASRRG